MEPVPQLPSLELLIAHQDWVRRLARKLVSRDEDVDDVAQSTFVIALSHPLRSGESAPALRAWLAQVARRLVIGRRRARIRREEREQAAARPEALPSASEIHEHEEERRVLVEALLSLHEPFRTTLLLRYYRELEPIEIARTLGVPDSTVRNRLARGLAQLKEKLETRQGTDWRSSCALLAAPIAPASKGLLLSKGIVMGTQWKLAFSVVLVVVAGVTWWELREPGAEGPGTATLESTRSPLAPVDETSGPETDATPRAARAKAEPEPSTLGAASAPPVAPASDAVGILLYGAVRRSDDGPTLGRARMRLLSSEGRQLDGLTDENGAFAFTSLTAGQWTLSAALTGYREQSKTLQLETSQPVHRVDVTLEGRLRIPVRFVTPEGESLQAALDQRRPASMLFAMRPIAVATEHAPGSKLAQRSLGAFERFGLGEYHAFDRNGRDGASDPVARAAEGELVVEDRFPMFVSAAWRGVVVETQRYDSAPEEIVFVLRPDRFAGLAGGFRLLLQDAEDHRPLKASSFVLAQRNATASVGVQGSEDGVIECVNLPPGTLQLSVACAGHESLIELVEIEPGTITDLGTRELARTTESEVLVVDGAGRPLAGVRFQSSSCLADGAGRPLEPSAVVESDPSGRLACRYRAAASWWIPCDDAWTTRPFQLGAGAGRRIVMQPGVELITVASEKVPEDALVLVRDVEGRLLAVESAEARSVVRRRLLPGDYVIELVTLEKTLLRTTVKLGSKPLVVELAP